MAVRYANASLTTLIIPEFPYLQCRVVELAPVDQKPRRLTSSSSLASQSARPFAVGVFGDNRGRMLDTHAVARSLTDAEFTPAQADAITNAVRLAAEHGDQVTSDQFKAGLAEVRTEIAEVRTEIAALDTRLSTQIANLDTRLSTQIAGVRTEVANLETRLIRWMVGTVLATGGLTFGILRFLG